MPLVFPDGDTSKRPLNDIYCELYDRAQVKAKAEQGLLDYNVTH